MTGVRIEVDDAAVRGALSQLAGVSTDLTRPLRAIGDYLVADTKLRFEAGRGPDRLPWKPSARALKEGGMTLVDSARLKASITRVVTSSSVQVGTNVKYAAIHQFGGEIRQFAYSRKVAFRTVKSRQEDGTLLTRRLFARSRGSRAHKRVEMQAVTFGDRVIKMPARPFLGLGDNNRETIVAIIGDHFRRITGADLRA